MDNCFLDTSNNEDDGVSLDADPCGTPAKEILWASEKGDLEAMKRLLATNAELVDVCDADGYTPLHRACYENQVEAARLLLDNGANVAAQTHELWQPLHSASRWNSVACVDLLLDYGADVNAVTKGGLTALHLAASNQNAHETLTVLLSHPLVKPDLVSSAGETALEITQRCGRLAKLFALVHPAINKTSV